MLSQKFNRFHQQIKLLIKFRWNEIRQVLKETGFGFIKLEYSQTDYDDISATTSNNTKVTADIDTNILALSFARNF